MSNIYDRIMNEINFYRMAELVGKPITAEFEKKHEIQAIVSSIKQEKIMYDNYVAQQEQQQLMNNDLISE